MILPAAVVVGAEDDPLGSRYVGRIPVRNLWLLMLYASELYRAGVVNAGDLEDRPDRLFDLVTEVLAQAVTERLHRGLTTDYTARDATLNRVRGRIDVLTTERRQLLARARVACRFNELTVDTPRHRYVLAALRQASSSASPSLSHRAQRLATMFSGLGVTVPTTFPPAAEVECFHRNDEADRSMVAAARLILEMALPNQETGRLPLPMPGREERWMRQLFERATCGFYRVRLPSLGWKVHGSTQLQWPVERRSNGMKDWLPGMRTDIVLDHPATNRRLVVDTKFNAILTSGWYREQTLRSAYLYQMYAYLRTQVGCGDALADTASGMLLHPTVGREVDEFVVLQGHAIRCATIDLAGSTMGIVERLVRLVERV